MNVLRNEIGRNILKNRQALKISSTELSRLSGVSQSSISKIERGTSSPNIETLIKICKALNITLYEVLPKSLFPEIDDSAQNNGKLMHVLNQLSGGEIEFIQSFLSTNVLSHMNNIVPLIQSFNELSDKERDLLRGFLNSITNITLQDGKTKREG
ncbi:helix-turn-helix domain-containing protein [Bacillus stratosphericus]|uniref:helix-turn-helix domain-containing protein n=1 Tax=Bacillus stratosphericus TaxID=293386 RepID=UPI001CFAFD70|nr:helix-turn-helix transcriptional regulator [Bacillus stratosphericus]